MALYIMIGALIGAVIAVIMAMAVGVDFMFELPSVIVLAVFFAVIGSTCGYTYGSVLDCNVKTQYIGDIDLLDSDFSCEIDNFNNKKVHVRNQEYLINSIEIINENGLFIETYANTTQVTKKVFYTYKLVIGNKTNNKKIDLFLKGNIINNDELIITKKIDNIKDFREP
ncbi:hypothetical protein [Lacrimispora amygdalina]|uniref:hypothetical protein n=1 Tax=Lacrimispora amygdalina TaxID=253257 RepID=UPI000BE45CED|nr:hypothetical protein [Lacrimispora amygdalina]